MPVIQSNVKANYLNGAIHKVSPPASSDHCVFRDPIQSHHTAVTCLPHSLPTPIINHCCLPNTPRAASQLLSIYFNNKLPDLHVRLSSEFSPLSSTQIRNLSKKNKHIYPSIPYPTNYYISFRCSNISIERQ